MWLLLVASAGASLSVGRRAREYRIDDARVARAGQSRQFPRIPPLLARPSAPFPRFVRLRTPRLLPPFRTFPARRPPPGPLASCRPFCTFPALGPPGPASCRPLRTFPGLGPAPPPPLPGLSLSRAWSGPPLPPFPTLVHRPHAECSHLRVGHLRCGHLRVGHLRCGHLRCGHLRVGHLRCGHLRVPSPQSAVTSECGHLRVRVTSESGHPGWTFLSPPAQGVQSPLTSPGCSRF